MRTRTLLSLCLAAASASAWAAPPAPTAFIAAHGGTLDADPVVVDDYVYLANGATITAWSRAQPGAPVRVGDTRTQPAEGWLTGLARRGDYLYASYRGYDVDTAAVAVYSIANRQAPTLVGHYEYAKAEFRMPASIVVVGDSLLVLDGESGIYTGNLADPAHPVFTQSYDCFGAFDHANVIGNRLVVSGRSFLGGTILTVFDVTNPAAVQELGTANLDGFDNFRVKIKAPYAVGFGLAVNITDFSDPAAIAPRGRIDSPMSYTGLLVGDYAWGVGGFDGVEVFNIADVDQPTHTGTQPIDTFSTDVTAEAASEGWLATRDDRLVRLDGSNAAQPTLGGTALLPGGTAPMDIAIVGDTALILGNAYGLQIADAKTLAPLGRFVTSLPQSLQGRAFEQVAVDGNRAYLTSWGSGLVIADITNPRAPTELSMIPLAFATSVAAQGNRAYVGTTTNGGYLTVFDVTNPAKPTELGSWAPADGDKMMRLAARGNYVYIATQTFVADGGGMFIIDVSNPASPVQVGQFSGCGAATDLVIDTSGKLAVVTGMQGTCLVDITNPALPVSVGTFAGTPSAVALHGDRLYIGGDTDVQEVDISNRASPTLVATHALKDSPRRIEAGADGRIYVITGYLGLNVYEPDRLFTDGYDH
jgi:hypothetical protein